MLYMCLFRVSFSVTNKTRKPHLIPHHQGRYDLMSTFAQDRPKCKRNVSFFLGSIVNMDVSV